MNIFFSQNQIKSKEIIYKHGGSEHFKVTKYFKENDEYLRCQSVLEKKYFIESFWAFSVQSSNFLTQFLTFTNCFQDGFKFQAFLHHNGHSVDEDFSVNDVFQIKINPVNDNSPQLMTKTHLLMVSPIKFLVKKCKITFLKVYLSTEMREKKTEKRLRRTNHYIQKKTKLIES